MQNNPVMQNAYPQNTWQLIKYIAKRIPKLFLKSMAMAIIIGVLGWLLVSVKSQQKNTINKSTNGVKINKPTIT